MANQPGKPATGAPPRPLAPKAAAPAPDEAPEKEQLVPSELDELTHAEYLALYDEAAGNVLFAKNRQWRVVEYFTLLGLALVGTGILAPFAKDIARFVAAFLVFVGIVSLILLLMLQSWQNREHEKMAYLSGDFSNFARTARRLKPAITGDIHRYFMLLVMLLYVVVLDFVFVRLLTDMSH